MSEYEIEGVVWLSGTAQIPDAKEILKTVLLDLAMKDRELIFLISDDIGEFGFRLLEGRFVIVGSGLEAWVSENFRDNFSETYEEDIDNLFGGDMHDISNLFFVDEEYDDTDDPQTNHMRDDLIAWRRSRN